MVATTVVALVHTRLRLCMAVVMVMVDMALSQASRMVVIMSTQLFRPAARRMVVVMAMASQLQPRP